jgi:H+/Cl- antiporter ClcA
MADALRSLVCGALAGAIGWFYLTAFWKIGEKFDFWRNDAKTLWSLVWVYTAVFGPLIILSIAYGWYGKAFGMIAGNDAGVGISEVEKIVFALATLTTAYLPNRKYLDLPSYHWQKKIR